MPWPAQGRGASGMKVYRITPRPSAEDLSGSGEGRWNSAHCPALYTTQCVSTAVLECLVHLEPDEQGRRNPHPDMCLVTFELTPPDDITELHPETLPPDWQQNPEACRGYGDALLQQAAHLGFQVPAAVCPHDKNLVLNPAFADFGKAVRIAAIEPIELDARLLG